MKLLVTGGSGFIGSAFIRHVLLNTTFHGEVVNYDALTYAASKDALKAVENDPRYSFVQGDVKDIESLFLQHSFTHVVHFAAESHVDRSIESAEPFLQSNVVGTVRLLEAVKKRPHIRFHHVSTDEVYGSLGETGEFTETSRYAPNSPYAASKAASDHFVRAYGKTYGLHVTMSHCSNNYGPFQHAEKFIPTVLRALQERNPIPIYGSGKNVRDWIHVDDHVSAIWTILCKGKKGEVYNVGGGVECSNMELAEKLIELFDPALKRLLTHVEDRKGHDFRYALSNEKMEKDFGWKPQISFEHGLAQLVEQCKKSVVCVIPARLHSTRFPKKILYPIAGKPLIQWTYEAAVSTGLFDEVIIALDDEETKAVVETFTTKYVMTSPDCPNGTARLLEVRQQKDADVWVNWQCDEPLVTKDMIETLLQGIYGAPAIWTLRKRCLEDEIEDKHAVKVVTSDSGRALYFSRHPIPYGSTEKWKHIGIYAYADSLLDTIQTLTPSPLAVKESLEQLTFLEAHLPVVLYTTEKEAIGIDVLADVKKVVDKLSV